MEREDEARLDRSEEGRSGTGRAPVLTWHRPGADPAQARREECGNGEDPRCGGHRVRLDGSGPRPGRTRACRTTTRSLGARPRLVSVADEVPGRAAEAAEQLGFDRSTQRWRDLLTDPAIDAISVTTPNSPP